MNNYLLFALTNGILVIWCLILTVLFIRERRLFQSLAKNVTKKDLLSLLKEISTSLSTASSKIETIESELKSLRLADMSHLQKIGFIRFNPFSDTGGDQSFCLCLLDQNNNGIVITSLHSRETTRIYGKVLDGSLNRADYSDEEWKAYQDAKKSS